MKQIKPEVIGYQVLNKTGTPCPILYGIGSLKYSSKGIIKNKLENLIQPNGKPKFRPVYKKEIQ